MPREIIEEILKKHTQLLYFYVQQAKRHADKEGVRRALGGRMADLADSIRRCRTILKA